MRTASGKPIGKDSDDEVSPEPKNLGGRPPHAPTDQSRRMVRAMAQIEIDMHRMCEIIGVTEKTLRRHYPEELLRSKTEMHVAVGQGLVLNAVGGPKRDWTKVNITAAIFVAKTRMGWKEPKVEVAHSGGVGLYDLSKVPYDQLKLIESILSPAAAASGVPSGDSST